MLRKEGMEYWIHLLSEIKDESLVDDYLDKSLVQICFGNIIQVMLRKAWSLTALPSLEHMESYSIKLNTNINSATLYCILKTRLLLTDMMKRQTIYYKQFQN